MEPIVYRPYENEEKRTKIRSKVNDDGERKLDVHSIKNVGNVYKSRFREFGITKRLCGKTKNDKKWTASSETRLSSMCLKLDEKCGTQIYGKWKKKL